MQTASWWLTIPPLLTPYIVFAIAMLAIFIYATKKHTASQKA